MKTFKIVYTEDFCDSFHTLTITAENKSKAYIEAYVQLPLKAAITNLFEVE